MHHSTAFPWTGYDDDPETATYNRALDGGSGDAELLQAVQDFIAGRHPTLMSISWRVTAVLFPTRWPPAPP